MYTITENASLLPHNTFGIEAQARYLCEYDTIRDLNTLLHDPRFQDLPLWHIGQGSNLLFTGDFPGVILHSCAKGIRIVEETGDDVIVEVEPGTVWDDVCLWAVEQGLHGAENLSAIPGETGAAVVQNIGAYGAEIKDIVHSVAVFDRKTSEILALSPAQMQYDYRYSILKEEAFKNQYIVVKVYLKLTRKEVFNLSYAGLRNAIGDQKPSLSLIRETVFQVRNSKLPDPKRIGNAGSFFKNPVIPRSAYDAMLKQYPTMPHYDVCESLVKVPAGWLIEQCGWKGRNLGRAGVYEKQSLVLVNLGGATAAEIMALSDAIVASVGQKFGILIEPEVNFV